MSVEVFNDCGKRLFRLCAGHHSLDASVVQRPPRPIEDVFNLLNVHDFVRFIWDRPHCIDGKLLNLPASIQLPVRALPRHPSLFETEKDLAAVVVCKPFGVSVVCQGEPLRNGNLGFLPQVCPGEDVHHGFSCRAFSNEISHVAFRGQFFGRLYHGALGGVIPK